MKFFAALVLGCTMFVGNAEVSAHHRMPVRQAAKATICLPVRVSRAVQEAQPICRVASLPSKVAKRWSAEKPVRSTLRRVRCGCR